MCGKKPFVIQSGTCSSGSTPHVWEKVNYLFFLFRHFWFNPTCVGKRSAALHCRPESWVQPHMRGCQFAVYHFPMKGIATRSDLQKQDRSFFFLVTNIKNYQGNFCKSIFPICKSIFLYKVFYE